MEHELAHAQSGATEFKLLAELLPQIVWTALPDGVLNYTNIRWREYSGSSEPRDWTKFVHPEDLLRITPIWLNSVQTGKPYETEFRLLRASDAKYRWHLVRAIAIRDEKDSIIKWFGTNTDIHDQRTFVQTLEKERDLREHFVSAITHDLRSPLTAAKMNAQLILRRLDKVEAVEKHANRIIATVDRADKMIQDVLDANLIRAGGKVHTALDKAELGPLIEESVKELASTHGDRFVLKPLPPIAAIVDKRNIQRVIEHLCANGIKYGDPQGKVTLSLESAGDAFKLSVHNFGNPLSEDEQKDLFQVFHRTEFARSSGMRGWGLGLIITRGIAKAHRGSICVHSAPDLGTTFTLQLPLDCRA